MARRVFFSFHYQRDIFRVNQVRNSWVTQERQAAGFFDASLSETEKTSGEAYVKRLIDNGLLNTSVTVVLIGYETAARKWVHYEIKKSLEKGNGLLGIYIHNLRDPRTGVDSVGGNPFHYYPHPVFGSRGNLGQVIPCYDWAGDNGYQNFNAWVEAAAKQAGR